MTGREFFEKGGVCMDLRRIVVGMVAVVAAGSCLARAEVVVSGSQVRAFLGNKTGKLVYTHLDNDWDDKTGRSLYYLDFSEETLVEHLVIDAHTEDKEPRNAVISRDGQWVAFNLLNTVDRSEGSSLYVVRLLADQSLPSSLGRGALPHWWTMPGTDDVYLVYNGRDLDEEAWVGCWGFELCYPPRITPTYCLQLNTGNMSAAGSPTELTNYQMNGGRSRNGEWLFAAGGLPMSVRVGPSVVEDANILEEVNLSEDADKDDDPLDGCNPSMSSHWASADVRLLYLDKPHTGYHICDVWGNNREHHDWGLSDNRYIDEPEMSTDNGFFTCKASRNKMEPPYDIYIVRLSDHQKLKVIEGNNSFPQLWVEGSNAVEPGRAGQSRPPGASHLSSAGTLVWRVNPGSVPRSGVLDLTGRVVRQGDIGAGAYLQRQEMLAQ